MREADERTYHPWMRRCLTIAAAVAAMGLVAVGGPAEAKVRHIGEGHDHHPCVTSLEFDVADTLTPLRRVQRIFDTRGHAAPADTLDYVLSNFGIDVDHAVMSVRVYPVCPSATVTSGEIYVQYDRKSPRHLVYAMTYEDVNQQSGPRVRVPARVP